MEKSWKARQMVPGKDTISIMALHYGFTPNRVRDIIKEAGAEVIREDGFQGTIQMVFGSEGRKKVVGWMDGTPGVDPDTTRLTRKAIMSVAQWAFEHSNTGTAA